MSTMSTPRILRCGRFTLDLSTPRVMGVVNVTPDSFSDGGRYAATEDALSHAERLIGECADLIDVGAESTRPGAVTVPADEEWLRLQAFLHALRDAPVPISVDTRKPEVMRRALDAGASMINDVAGFATVEARSAVAWSDCALCVMHMQGQPATMQQAPRYVDVVSEVKGFLDTQTRALLAAGVAADRIAIDPGFGFGKDLDHNLALLRALDRIVALGSPVLVGLSRKGMIGALTGRPVDQRLAGGIAAALAAVEQGAAIVRTHDVAATVDALNVWTALRATQDSGAAADERGSTAR
jgi:dihydropteroate synthase